MRFILELDRRTTSKECPKTEKREEKSEPVENNEKPLSPKATRSTSPVQIPVEISPPVERPKETANNVETTKEEKDDVEGGVPVQQKETKTLTLDETLMEDLTPNTRRKVFRKAFSMRINRGDETVVQQTTGSQIEQRHSFGGSEKVQPRSTYINLFIGVRILNQSVKENYKRR